MKLYIFGQGKDGKTFGDGTYTIITEHGEPLASHWSSHLGFAKSDLESGRPERQKEWKERFGEYQVIIIGDDEMTVETLIERNKVWYATKSENTNSANSEVDK